MRDLNVKQIEALTEPRTYRVSKSLYLQIGPTGTKAWLFRYTKDGRAHGMGLGPLDLVTLAEARDRTLTCRKLLLDGIDPLEERRGKRLQTRLAAAGKITFHSCAERYIDAHAAGWRNRKHRQQWTNTLTTYAYPAIGDLPVGAIDTGLIMKIIEPIWQTKTETASRLRGRIESILDWAKARHYRTGENPARWRGHLDQLLAARSKVAPTNHHAALSYAELPAFMTQLRQHSGAAARCLEFTILTAARSGEARGARWSEFDLDAHTWTVPAERTKAGKAHTVPLSEHARTILAGLPRSGDYLFENGRAGKPMGGTTLTLMLREMNRGDIKVHGFRSTFRDWAAEQTHHQNHVVEMALAHAIGDKVEAAYRRGDLLAKRRELMQDWARYCAS